jgi:two-component system LytT family response regulator
MIKAIIIDDESKARDLLELLIKESGKNIRIVAKCQDLKTGIEQITLHQPDVVFLDIEMPHASGLQILEHIPYPDFEIIFATAYDQYAIKAFELSALDYLLKPIDEDKLALSIDKLGQRIDMKIRLESYAANKQQKEPVTICLPISASSHEMIFVKNILCIEADRNYSVIHTLTKKYTISKSLSYFVDKYLPIDGFIRTHRSWIVNLYHVQKLNFNKKELSLDKLIIPVSRGNFAKVKKRMGDLA